MKAIGIALALLVLTGCATNNLPQPTGERVPVNKQ
jgi:uncharacterized lipoprotein YajG